MKATHAENPDEIHEEVQWMEVAMPSMKGAADGNGYEIAWRTGTRLSVPRGFCVEEVAMLVELLRDAE